MKNLLIAVALMFSVSAFAAVEVDTRGLSDTQKAELVKAAEAMKKDTTPLNNVDAVDKWVNVGERLGKMMGGAAKEIGVAANDFVQTPVGLMTTGLIVWNYMGGMIVHVVSGWAFLIITFSLLFIYSRRLRKVKITYDKENGRNWLGKYPVLSKEVSAIDSDEFGILMLGYAVCIVISVWIMFSW